MNEIGNSIVSFVNGLYLISHATKNPIAIAAILLIISFAWVSLLEIDELNRQGSKPEVGRH